MSVPPKPPGRVEAKNSVSSSDDNAGNKSSALLFTLTMFSGGDHESKTLLRFEVHRSRPPVPGRVEWKKTSDPFRDRYGARIDLRAVEPRG